MSCGKRMPSSAGFNAHVVAGFDRGNFFGFDSGDESDEDQSIPVVSASSALRTQLRASPRSEEQQPPQTSLGVSAPRAQVPMQMPRVSDYAVAKAIVHSTTTERTDSHRDEMSKFSRQREMDIADELANMCGNRQPREVKQSSASASAIPRVPKPGTVEPTPSRSSTTRISPFTNANSSAVHARRERPASAGVRRRQTPRQTQKANSASSPTLPQNAKARGSDRPLDAANGCGSRPCSASVHGRSSPPTADYCGSRPGSASVHGRSSPLFAGAPRRPASAGRVRPPVIGANERRVAEVSASTQPAPSVLEGRSRVERLLRPTATSDPVMSSRRRADAHGGVSAHEAVTEIANHPDAVSLESGTARPSTPAHQQQLQQHAQVTRPRPPQNCQQPQSQDDQDQARLSRSPGLPLSIPTQSAPPTSDQEPRASSRPRPRNDVDDRTNALQQLQGPATRTHTSGNRSAAPPVSRLSGTGEPPALGLRDPAVWEELNPATEVDAGGDPVQQSFAALQAQFEMLTSFTSHEDLPDPCAICLDPMCIGHEVARLLCGHCFHQSCVKGWLVTSLKCPLCKRSLTRRAGAVTPNFRAWS